MKRFELEGDTKISANNYLRLVNEGFRSTPHNETISPDARNFIDAIKNHMLIQKRTLLIGEDLVTQIEGVTHKLNVKVDLKMIEKLGFFREYYTSYVSAQK